MIRILLRCFSVLLPSWAMLVAPAWGQSQRPLLHELVLTHTDHEVLLHIELQGGVSKRSWRPSQLVSRSRSPIT